MGLLDMLFGGAQAPAQAGVPPPSQGLPPLALGQPSQLAIPPATGGQTVPDGGSTNEITVTAHRQRPPTMTQPPPPPVQEPPGRVDGGYNNMDAVQQLGALQGKYAGLPPSPADGPHTGLVSAIPSSMPGGGTLRSLLGTLGDAFLVQSGHQPAYAQRMEREQIAHAGAGFDTDPMGAAARIAATGAPGAQQDAQSMYSEANNAQLRLAQQQANNDYRNSMVGIRRDAEQSQAAVHQQQIDDRTRSAMGAIMMAAARTGDPNVYAQARQRALALGGARIPGFDPDVEIPAKLGDYQAGYGMTAGQVAKNQTSQDSIAERAQAAGNRNQVTERGQNMSAASAAGRTGAMLAGQQNSIGAMLRHYAQVQDSGGKLTQSQQAIWDKYTHVNQGGSHLNIPGLTGGGQTHTAPAGRPQFVNGQVYRDAHGNTATYQNGKWIQH